MKKIFLLLICFLLLLGMVTTSVVATEAVSEAVVYEKLEINADGSFTPTGNVIYSGTVYGAVDFLVYGESGGVVVLRKDVKLNRGLTLQPVVGVTSCILVDGKVTVDLNGYSITQQAGGEYSINPAVIVPKYSVLTLKDSSEKQSGTVNGVQFGVEINGGRLNLSGGTIKAQAQANVMFDDAEIPVKIKNYGTFSLNGGKVLYSGELEDGRTYYEKSCAVMADETGMLEVTGGKLQGEVEVDEENFKVQGGTFDFDVSHLLSPLYTVIEEKGSYKVEYVAPYVVTDGCDATVNVVMDEKNDAESIKFFEVSAKADDEYIRMDIRNLLDVAVLTNQEEVPEIRLYTSFADIVLDSKTVEQLATDGKNYEVWLSVQKNSKLSADITDKMSNMKYEVVFQLTNEDGDRIFPDCEARMIVHHKADSVVNGIQMHHMDEGEIKTKISTVSGNDIHCKTKNGEKLLVSEGIAMMITGRTIDVYGTISVVFYADLIGVNHSEVRMLFWDSPQSEYTVETAQRSISYSSKDEYGYRFEYGGITAKDMNMQIYARLCTTDASGKIVYGKEPKSGYGVTNYAKNLLKNPEVKPLLVSMVNYGATAQKYFGSEQEPANMILMPEERVIDYSKVYTSTAQTITEESRNGICPAKISGKSLILESDISISYYVQSSEAVEEIGVLFWNEGAFNGVASHVMGTQSRKVSEYTMDSGYLVFEYDDIASNRMFDNIYARVYTKKDGVYKYSDIEKYSVKDYVANQLVKSNNPDLINLLRSLMIYGEESKKFFG